MPALAKTHKFGRNKPKYRPNPNAAEKRHWERVSKIPCLVCGSRETTIHHVTASIHGGRLKRDHTLVAPLCKYHHQNVWDSKDSVEALSHKGFYAKYGIDLLREAEFLKTESQMEGLL